MPKKTDGAISSLMARRSNLVELVLVAIGLALSVNFVSDSLPTLISLPPEWTFAIGLALGLVVMIYSVVRLFGVRHNTRSFDGFFVYDKGKNQLISVPRYQYSDRVCRYFESAFNENKALEALWNREPLSDIYGRVENGKIARRTLRSFDLIIEATEYFIIAELSMHLSAYFNDDKYPKESLRELSRTDIPDVLLSNRFLELFSKAMEERASFIEGVSKDRDIGNVVYATGEGGAIYDRFELTLPGKSKVKRISKNALEIETSRFKLLWTVDFAGLNTYIPFKFHRYVLDIDRDSNLSDFRIGVTFDVFFKSGALLSPRGWDYFFWIDSFLEGFQQRFEQEAFFEAIGWEKALTIFEFISARERNDAVK